MKEFATYYYNVSVLWQIDKDQLIKNLSKKIWNIDWYEIKKTSDNNFFIHCVKKHKFDLFPKKWKDNDVTKLKTLELEDWEWLFSDIFIYLDTSNLDIFNDSIWVISVLKAWREASHQFLWKLFEEIYSLKETCIVLPITYKDADKYIESLTKINWFSFSVASANMQRALWVSESDGMWDLFRLKEQLGWDLLNFSISSREWLPKNKIKAFFTTYRHIFAKSPKITVDEVWKHIKQEIDKIRFKSTVSIELEEWELNFEMVETRMQEDFKVELEKIKKEYNYIS